MENTQIIISNKNYVAPVVNIEEAKKKFETVRRYTRDCLTEGIDFGKIPGVQKPSLLKPGAEKIANLFGLSHKFEKIDQTKNWTGEGNPDNEPFFEFEYRCSLYKGDQFIGNCDGSCNSWEKKYRYRRADYICPICGKATIKKSKYDDGYYCYGKIGGCGAKFGSNDTRITSQPIGDIKNFDTAEQVNTIQKMAQKRAYVGAVIMSCNLSEYFTQDVEDMDSGLFQTTPTPPAPMEAEIINGDYEQIPSEEEFNEDLFLKSLVIPDNIPYITPAKANQEVDSKGLIYGDIPSEQLKFRINTLNKVLKKENLSEEKKKEALDKLGIIYSVLGDRKTKKQI